MEYLLNSERQRENSSIRKESIIMFFSGSVLIAGGIWKGDILIADIEELEKLGASEIYPRRLNAKEVLITQKDGEFVFLVTDGSAKSSRRDYEFQEPTLRRDPTVRRESPGDGEEFQPEETEDDEEIHEGFWSIQGDFIFRHHIEPRVQLYMPREESFPIPLKYNDVTRSTHTDSDIAQEKRIDDYWNVDGNRNLSDSWTCFKRFTLLNETPPKGYMWSGRRLTKIQTISCPDHMRLDARIRFRKKRTGNQETKTRTCQKIARNLFH